MEEQNKENNSLIKKIINSMRHEIFICEIVLVFFGALYIFNKGLIGELAENGWIKNGWAIGCVIIISFISAIVSSVISKKHKEAQIKYVIDSFSTHEIELKNITNELKRQIDAIQNLSKAWEKLSEWTVAESHVLEIEREWKGSAYILVPDLHYELDEKSELRKIIADNICKAEFKGYIYFLPDSQHGQFKTFKNKIRREISLLNMPPIFCDQKLKCCIIPMNEFPFAATAGVVLYTDSNDREDFAFSHLPIEFPAEHLNIQLNRESEHQFFSNLKSNLLVYLNRLIERFPPT